MSAFEDEFEIPAATEVDPAAEFLAKEQEELGDIGEDLGISASASSAAPDLTTNDDDEVLILFTIKALHATVHSLFLHYFSLNKKHLFFLSKTFSLHCMYSECSYLCFSL